MRTWTTPAALGGLLLVTGVTAFSARTRPTDAAPVAMQSDTPQVLQLVVGDTVRLVLRRVAADSPRGTHAGRVVRILGRRELAGAAARFTSADPSRVAIRGNLLTALAAGTTTVNAAASDEGMSSSLTVRVVTSEQATNIMAAEICPNNGVNAFLDQQPLPETVHAIHEFHDCQRLIDGNRYSALAGIFAHENVAIYDTTWRQWQDGRLAAIIVNWGTGIKTHIDTASYVPLRIAPGINCLYLQASADSVWNAALTRQSAPHVAAEGGKVFAGCDETLRWSHIPESAKHGRVVRRERGVDMNGRPEAPPVARWDWDPVRRINYMGVKCGRDAWCEIGPTGFTPSTPLAGRGGRQIIKGYYDQQYLADSTAQAPSTVFGTIRPGVHAYHRDSMDFDRKRWYHVAQIELVGDGWFPTREYARYVRNFTGRRIIRMLPKRTVSIKYELEPIHPPTHVARRVYNLRMSSQVLDTGAIHFRQHSQHAANVQMPTTRWRWKGNDESTWTYCKPDGCCESVNVLVQ